MAIETAILEPYLQLTQSPTTALKSILISPSVSPLAGIIGAIRRRNLYLASVALVAITSNFLPILLSNIPFSPSQTWLTHQACTWTAVAILLLMIMTLVHGIVFVRYPYLPADPSTIAGSLYYLCDSVMVLEFLDSIHMYPEKEPCCLSDKRKLHLGTMTGFSGETRVVIDYTDTKE
jgi:hypothetical protein